MFKLTPPKVVALSFLIVIAIGTILLSLPISNNSGEPLNFIDALFTATSATCVTGLTVRDTGSFFSPFGKSVILILFQIGGLGIMTLSTLFAIALGRKLTIKENLVIQRTLDQHHIIGLRQLIKYILLITISIQTIGVVLLYLYRSPDGSGLSLYQAIFHSVSAFCNAGFSLFKDSFTQFRASTYINLVMTFLIISGGLGFVVLIDLFKIMRRRKYVHSKLTLQTKIVFSITVFLLLTGTIILLVTEWDNTLAGMNIKEKILASYFQAVTPRTAGFNTLSIGALTVTSQFLLILFMFIGASPGSTGGGIKTATFGIVIVGLWAMIRNKQDIVIFKKTIPKKVFHRALSVLLLSLIWIVIFTLILTITERTNLGGENNYFIRILFETTSAFSTVGLSTGITPNLTPLGKLLITLTMYVGRVGPLALGLVIALQEKKVLFKYPEERVMIG